MKKLILSGLLLGLTLFVQAQKTDSTASKSILGNNELKLNLIYTVAGFPELNYERIIKDDMSVGVALLVGLEENSEYSFGIVPNYRVYFGSKKASGFFIEANAAVISNRNNYKEDYIYSSYPYGYSLNNKTYTNFGLGAAAGAKFLTKNGFVGEVFAGAGRLFGKSAIDAYPRGGITIGKRF